MKKFLLLAAFSCALFLSARAQEDPEVTQRLKAKYKYVSYDEDYGHYRVWDGKLHGICDRTGNEIIPMLYESTFYDSKGYFSIKKGGLTSILDRDGKTLIPFHYEDVLYYQILDYGYCKVKSGGKWGVMDRSGKEIVPCRYDDANSWQFEDSDYCTVVRDGKKGVVDKSGKEIIPCRYDDINTYALDETDYCTATLHGKKGLVSKSGEEVLPFEYDAVGMVSNGDYVTVNQGGSIPEGAWMTEGGKWGVYSVKQGKIVVPLKYDYIGLPFKGFEGLATFNVGGRQWSKTSDYSYGFEGGLWGYVDMQGNEVIPAQYEHVNAFQDGIAQVTKDGVTSIITNPLTGTEYGIAASGGGSPVDANIPETGRSDDTKFAFIVANEVYLNYDAPYALRDGEIFKAYCLKRLGIPESNIRYYENATFGNLVRMRQTIKDIADVYEGDATIIVYFSGLGISGGAGQDAYLLPVDVSLASLSATACNVNEFVAELSRLDTKCTLLLLDAAFSGAGRDGKPLAESRGVAIKPKAATPSGNLLVFCAASDTEAAYASESLRHGLFTNALLGQWQKQASLSLRDLIDNVTFEVKKQSLQEFGNVQTPSVIASPAFDWSDITF